MTRDTNLFDIQLRSEHVLSIKDSFFFVDVLNHNINDRSDNFNPAVLSPLRVST